MLGRDAMVKAMSDILAPGGLILTDPDAVNENVKGMLGEFGINPDDAFTVGNMIMQGAVAANEAPEQTVVQAFVVGIAIGARLAQFPEGRAA